MKVDKPFAVSRGAVGFTLHRSVPVSAKARLTAAQSRALRHFPWLKSHRIEQGNAVIHSWTHHEPAQSFCQADNGALFILVGSPMNDVLWSDALQQLSEQGDDHFELPWEGRCILIRISPDGRNWTIWNDWAGSVPVFHTSVQGIPIAGSLEPVVVAAAGFTPDDFSKRGLVELLVYGHFLGTDTLYRNMHTLPPDSVSRWEEGSFCGSRSLWTVEPSDARGDRDWDELASEMHELTVKTISSALRQHDKWLLPLSGGMDSRLIACVAKDMGTDIRAYTYGPRRWYEVRYARQLAQALDLEWQRVDMGWNYLADFTPMWLDWFGSSIHAHGMYQMPFLEAVREVEGCIMEGFYGNNMAGGNHPSTGLLNGPGSVWRRFYAGYHGHWSLEELRNLVTFDVEPSLDEMRAILSDQEKQVETWPYYQRMNVIDMWNRQQRFIFYQPTMYDYWKGVSEPYTTSEYARFSLSLPRQALEGRRLQRQMLNRFWPEAAKVNSTFEEIALIERAKRSLMHRIAARVPYGSTYGVLQRLLPWPNTLQIDCVSARKWEALYPITPSLIDRLPRDAHLNRNVIVETCHRALAGDKTAHRKLWPLQTVLYRITGASIGH